MKTKHGDFYHYSGVIHVHTSFSDGGGSFDEIASEAKKLGLDYIITTDHNTIEPFQVDHSRWIDKTVLIPSIEIATEDWAGHFFVLGDETPMEQTSEVKSYDILKDSKERGLSTFVAHGCHPSPKVDWHDWDRDDYIGMEIFNLDSCWRENKRFPILSKLFFSYLCCGFRDSAMNHMVRFPARELRKFDELNKKRKVVAIGSTDAHSRVKLSRYINVYVRFPSYRGMFNLVRTVVLSSEKLTGDYKNDKRILVDAIKNGNSYVTFPVLGSADGFSFRADTKSGSAVIGEYLQMNGRTNLKITVPNHRKSLIQLVRNGDIISEYKPNSKDDMYEINQEITEDGVYRVQAFLFARIPPFPAVKQFPWILSNPIYVKKKA
jgi:hypothetical protein